jgi:hypothetical protein
VDRCLEYGSFNDWIVDALRERFGLDTPKVAAEEQVDWGIQRWKQRHPEARIYRATHNGLPPADWKPDGRPGIEPDEHLADEIVAEQERLETDTRSA